MLKWFNIKGIISEIKKIRWPKAKELFDTFFKVCLFILLFMIFFFVADFVVSVVTKLLGI